MRLDKLTTTLQQALQEPALLRRQAERAAQAAVRLGMRVAPVERARVLLDLVDEPARRRDDARHEVDLRRVDLLADAGRFAALATHLDRELPAYAVPLFVRFRDETLSEFPHAKGRRLLFDTIRRMLSAQVPAVLVIAVLNAEVIVLVTELRVKTAARVWVMRHSAPSVKPWSVQKCLCANWPRKPMVKH